jgi:hypothetical protein
MSCKAIFNKETKNIFFLFLCNYIKNKRIINSRKQYTDNKK